jgi:hypothetical protein
VGSRISCRKLNAFVGFSVKRHTMLSGKASKKVKRDVASKLDFLELSHNKVLGKRAESPKPDLKKCV